MDFATFTLKDLLEKNFGPEAAKKVLQEGNDAFQRGVKGQDLVDVFRNTLKQEGHVVDAQKEDILLTFVRGYDI